MGPRRVSPVLEGIERFGYSAVIRPALFRLNGGDAEKTHEQMIKWLATLPPTSRPSPSQHVEIAGIRFPNRVGVAAGMDKDGIAAAAWAHLGFGFAELGTVTAQAQPGNPQPRLFRLPKSKAIINRMGFNNRGASALASRLHQAGVRRGNEKLGIAVGVSIGKSKVVPLEQAVDDYLASLTYLAEYADYVAINISSPNTPGLRSLQAHNEISNLVTSLVERAQQLDPDPVPIFVKLSPDMDRIQLAECVDVIEASGASGVIATNTTIKREGLARTSGDVVAESGGLSGAPLTARSLHLVEMIADRTSLPVIGVGGIMSPDDASRMFAAGADLVQLYTGFIYRGPWLTHRIARRDRA